MAPLFNIEVKSGLETWLWWLGEFVVLDSDTENISKLEYARILMRIASPQAISTCKRIVINKGTHEVQFIEESLQSFPWCKYWYSKNIGPHLKGSSADNNKGQEIMSSHSECSSDATTFFGEEEEVENQVKMGKSDDQREERCGSLWLSNRLCNPTR